MAKFLTLVCPTCGGKLNISDVTDRFFCVHCGNEHLVTENSEGTFSIEPVKIALDNLSSEMAIARLEKELVALKEQKKQLVHSIFNIKPSTRINALFDQRTQISKPSFSCGTLVLVFFLAALYGAILTPIAVSFGYSADQVNMLMFFPGLVGAYFTFSHFMHQDYKSQVQKIETDIASAEASDREQGIDTESRLENMKRELSSLEEAIAKVEGHVTHHRNRVIIN